MLYIISTPSGEKIKIQYDEWKPVSKVKITVITNDNEEISKNVSIRKE